jgi:hypothetical protein
VFRTFALLALFASSREDLESAVRLLANKIALHLAANEAPRLTVRNISSLPGPDVVNVRTGLMRALPKRTRNGSAAEIAVTISENIKGYVLVAEIRKRDSSSVEMVSFKPELPPPAPTPITIVKRLAWEQTEPILDLREMGDQMLILEPERVVRYERRLGVWQVAESAELAAPALRDPRGRMDVEQDNVNVFLPSATCRGTWQPLKLACEPGTAEFILDGAPAHFTSGRNTIEGQHRLSAGDAISACGNKTLASSDGGMDANDTVVLFDGAAAVSEPAEFPGPITALWPATDGALAVARNLTTKNYAAYALSVDCGH